jgi:AraC family transcriptional regulator, arabinose operon regulatory protein
MAETEFVASCFHTPSPQAQGLFYTIVRAGHLRAAPDYRIERRSCLGQDMLFCLAGAGFIQCAAGDFRVQRGELAWIDGRYPHGHHPDPQDPWELLWLRFDTHDLPQLCAVLSIHKAPVFRHVNQRRIKAIFQRILEVMQHRPLAMEALLHAEMASLLAQLFRTRLNYAAQQVDFAHAFSPQLERAFTQMKLYAHRPWQVRDLARLAGMSAAHFFRRFKQATGSSPIDWLRRERINQAKRHLIETADPIRDIADRVGYSDPFYFSRDFKHITGHSPSEYRRHEQHPEPNTPAH